MTDENQHTVEQRLQIIEDKLAIYELIASHAPSADTGLAEYTASVYMKDGVFNRGKGLDGAKGVEAIAAFILRPSHEEAIKGGLAHFAGLPLIDLRGNKAIVTSYLQLLQLNTGAGNITVFARHHFLPRDKFSLRQMIMAMIMIPLIAERVTQVMVLQHASPIDKVKPRDHSFFCIE